eukprot:GFUD01021285.1.p1 GENE.GFUD01021285.1~~GFUD01021285.1.p1  ORF type:complete len:1759 (-),score=675.16 GFUD01021285.1:47-5323(-)
MSSRHSSGEDLVTPCVSLLNSLALHTVNNTWVDSVWDGQFTELQELPADYEEVIQGVEVRKVLAKVQELAIKWIKVHGQEETSREEDAENTSQSVSLYRAGFWTIMTEQNIKYKVLVALLYHYMERGQEMASGEQERQLAMQAAGLYLVLLGLPGSGAFKIFHPVLYSKALDTFNLVTKLGLGRRSPKKKGGAKKTSQASQRGGRGTQASQGEVEEEEEEEGVATLSQREVGKVVQGLSEVLSCLHIMLENCSLKRSLESIESTVASMVTLTHLETTFSVLDLGTDRRDRSGDVSALAVNAYLGLAKLGSPLHGEGAGGASVVLKGLLPGVLMVGEGTGNGLGVIRAHSLRFIRFLMVGGGDAVCSSVAVLVQHLAVKVPDKAEFRREAAEAIVSLMVTLTGDLYSSSLRWFVRYAHSEKASNRLFSLEVVGRLMYTTRPEEMEGTTPDASTIHQPTTGMTPASTAEPSPGPTTPSSPPETSTPATLSTTLPNQPISNSFLFACIYGRCGDISASVRAQALKTLGDITGEQTGGVKEVLDTIFSQGKATRGKLSLTEVLEDETLDLSNVDFLPSGGELIQFLRRRALDQSVFVRKSALQVLENILKTSDSLLADDLVEVMAEHCRDSSLAVRKQMVISLTELVKTYPDKEGLVSTWVQAVFPLILDVEQKASEKVLECIWECLFGNLVTTKKASTAHHALPWLILTAVETSHMANYLARACNTWAKEARLTSTVLSILQSYIGTDHNGPAWMLLGLISTHVPCKDPHMVMEYFNTSISTPEGVGLYTLLQVLKVLFASVSKLSEGDRSSLQKNLLALVQRFKVPPELIAIAVDVITVVSSLQVPKENLKQYQSAVDAWAVPILENIDSHLSSVLLKSPTLDCPVEEELLIRQIFTLGELCQVCPHRTNKRMFLLMQSIVFQQGVPSTSHLDTLPDIPTLPTSQTQSSQPPALQFVPSTKLQSLTVVTLGKMCLQNEDQAKKIIPAFGQILDTHSDSSIKNNIMYSLTDMCVRYASLVDPLLPQMTACLKDRSLSVRRTTLILLIHLLQEDYLKIRGNGKFFFRLIQTLQDSSEEIRHLTTFYIQQRLLKRIPKIMYSHFVESVFHLNDYQDHASYNKFVVTAKEKKMFNMSGEKHETGRRELYRFMLENMNDEQRFQTTYRLCQDILGGVVEGTVSLSPASMPLLRDTFYCLASDSIKLASLKSKGGEEEAETEQEMAGKVLEAAKKTIISGVVKKNVMENIIPIIIALKHKLESAKSPLVSDLFKYLRKLMEDYKNEVTDILAADKQLAKEIEFDLRRYEQEQEEQKEREEQEKLAREQRQSNSRPGTPRSPGPATPRSSGPGTPRSSRSATPRSSVQGSPSTVPNTPAQPDLIRQALHNAITQTAKKGSQAGKMASKLLDTFNAANNDSRRKSGVEQAPADIVTTEPSDNVTTPGKNDDDEVTAALTAGEKESAELVTSKDGEQVTVGENLDKEEEQPADRRGQADTEEVAQTGQPEGEEVLETATVSGLPAVGEADGGQKDVKEASNTKTDVGDEVDKEASDTEAVTDKNDDQEASDTEAATDKNDDQEASDTEAATGKKDNLESSEGEVGQTVDQEASKDPNKSKRISGQGMERQKQHKTPRSKRTHNVRAISTPQVNKTVLGDNVTFLGESVLDLSCITVLSPPSALNDPDSRRGSTSTKNKDDTDAVSFRFRKGGKDLFEELVEDGQEGSVKGKRKSEDGRKEDNKRAAGGRRTGGSLGVIQEEEGGKKGKK